MHHALRSLAPPSLLALSVLAAGCASQGPRPVERQASYAIPEADPSTRGTVRGPRVLSEVEQIVVRMGRDPDGRAVVLQVLSPVLTPEQQEEVRRAFAIGGWKRGVPLPTQTESWIETITRTGP